MTSAAYAVWCSEKTRCRFLHPKPERYEMATVRTSASPVQAEETARPVQQEVEYITLQNRSETEPQHVFVVEKGGKGRRYSIPPAHVMPFPRDIAEQFLRDCGRWVCIYKQVYIPASEPGMPKAWVANMTGNPSQPVQISVIRVEHGEKVTVMVPNPLRIPTPLRFKISRSQETIKTEDGETTYNWPPDMLCLPPFARLEIPANVALQIQNRDSMQDEGHRGRVARCRAPSAFEPNETWDYDDLRAYAVITAPQVFVEGRMNKAFPPATKCKDRDELEARKWDLLHDLFFIQVDDNYNLPTREQFEALKTAALQSIA
jgi:hypothetical protein